MANLGSVSFYLLTDSDSRARMTHMSNEQQRIEELSKRVADLEAFVADLLGFTTRRIEAMDHLQAEDYYYGGTVAYATVRNKLNRFLNPSSNPTT